MNLTSLLPDEIIKQILFYFDYFSQLSIVCKRWNVISKTIITIKYTRIDKNISEILTDEHLINMTFIKHMTVLKGSLITDKGLKLLTNITNLNLYNNMITNESLNCLHLLTSMVIKLDSNNTISLNTTLIELSELRLKCLILEGDRSIIDDQIKHLTTLSLLNLTFNKLITNNGISNLTSLTTLSLSCNKMITDDSLQLLTNLNALALICNYKITNNSLRLLTNLMYLDLSYNYTIDDNGISMLTNLRQIDITSCNRITNNGISMLTNLKNLGLCKNQIITNSGIGNLTKLRYINLSKNSLITNDGVKNLTKLEHMCLYKNSLITIDGVKNLPLIDVSLCKSAVNETELLVVNPNIKTYDHKIFNYILRYK